MTDPTLEQHLPLLKALANESRLRLIALIAKHEQSVGSLARSVGLTEPTVSHHLAKLSEVGLIDMRAVGTTHYYRFNPKSLAAINRSLLPASDTSIEPPASGPEGYDARVLRSFVVDGRLTKIPDTRQKRLVILRWLIEHFECGVDYAEREVNAIIKRFHPDFATIRREFIGYGLMQREAGIYRKVALARART
jgi:hypothetical protein